jgi:hypothetical protein
MADFLGIGTDADRMQERPPAFTPPTRALSNEHLVLLERVHRIGSASYPGALEIIFTTVDEVSGEESFDEGQGEVWQALMSWPRVPTIPEVEAYKLSQLTRMRAAHWLEFQKLDAVMT